MYDRIELPTVPPRPCGAPATVRLEGYSARDGLAHGSLDVIVYACQEHTDTARTEWLAGLTPYGSPVIGTARCGDRFSFTNEDVVDQADGVADDSGAGLAHVGSLGGSCAGLGGVCVVDHSARASNPEDVHCDGPPVTMAGPLGPEFPGVHLSQWTGDTPQMVIGNGCELSLADVDQLLSDLRGYEAHILALRAQLAALLGGGK